MNVEATTDSPFATGADTIVVGVFEGEDVAHDLPGGDLGALLASGEARREFKRLALTHADGARVILVGLGERAEFDGERARVTAAVAHGRAREIGASTLCWEVPHHVSDQVVEGLVQGTLLHAYRFERYKPSEDSRRVERLLVSAHHDVSEPVRVAAILATAQNRARDLGNTPGNDLPPGALASYAEEVASRHGLGFAALEEEAIREAGMGAFAAVAQGSAQSARLIRLDYDGTVAGERATDRAGREGGDLRLRRDLAQAGRDHVRDEVRHVRRRGGDRGDRRPGRACACRCACSG